MFTSEDISAAVKARMARRSLHTKGLAALVKIKPYSLRERLSFSAGPRGSLTLIRDIAAALEIDCSQLILDAESIYSERTEGKNDV